MKSKFIIVIFFTAALGLISASVIDHDDIHSNMKSGGGPANNTNAPTEKTCSGTEGTSSCHSGGIPDNTGPATTLISSSGGTVYVPGQTYTITCSITHSTRTRFGFQCTARRLSNNAVGGTITVTDATNTWLHPATNANCTTCQYLCHKLAGTYFNTTTGSWTFNWTAPSSNVGSIRFYSCFLAANNNNTNDSGDQVFYTTLTLTPSAVGINELEFIHEINISPNPSSGEFFVNTDITEPKDVSVFNVQGKLIEKISSSEEINKIDLKGQPKGIYFIKISAGEKSAVKKVVIE